MQAPTKKTCLVARDHMESVDEPGRCVWCDKELMSAVVMLNARESYAYSLYREHLAMLGPRGAYDNAVLHAGLRTATERNNLRRALSATVVSLTTEAT